MVFLKSNGNNSFEKKDIDMDKIESIINMMVKA